MPATKVSTAKRSPAKRKVQAASRKKKVVRKTVSRKPKVLEEMIDSAKEEKELYKAIPAKYRRKIRELVRQCKERGYVTSDVLMKHIPLEECDDAKDTWECIERIMQNNCVDVVEKSGLLEEVEMGGDPRFPEIDSSSYDSIQMYLRDIGKYPLLTSAEEKELGAKIVARNNVLEKKTRKKLTPSARRRILAEGLDARNKLAVANLRLVVSVAKNYTGRSRDRDLTLLDLVQEGAKGLYHVANKFDPARGCKFSTYATWWIRQAIIRGIADKSRTVRIPVHMREAAQKYQKTIVQLEKHLGRTPTVQEIADELDMETEKVHMIRKTLQDIVQLEKPIGDSGDGDITSYADTIEDITQETQDSLVSKDILQGQVRTLLRDLPARDRQVIELRHGMQDGVQYTLEQIGTMMGITRERVRQIESRALEKLRSSSAMRKLKSY